MTDQPNPNVDDITGYRRLDEDEIALINEGKALANQVGEFVARLNANQRIDPRWLAVGRTDLQKGFMSVIRSIAKPGGF